MKPTQETRLAISVWHISYYKCPDGWRCFISIAFQLCFRECHWIESSKSGRVETDWYSLPSGLGWWH